MIDIKIGGISPAGGSGEGNVRGNAGAEARVLAVRSPRHKNNGRPPAADRRARQGEPDPPTGKVLVLLIPDSTLIPEGLETGAYRVFIRFARK